MPDDVTDAVAAGDVAGDKTRFAETVCSEAGKVSSGIGFSGGKLAVVIRSRFCWLADSLSKAGNFWSSIDFSGGWVAAVVLSFAAVVVDDVVNDAKRSMGFRSTLLLSSIGFNGSRLLVVAAVTVVVAAAMLVLRMCCCSGVPG